MQADASEAFKAAKDAYEVLSNPQQRAAYNSSRKRQVGWCLLPFLFDSGRVGALCLLHNVGERLSTRLSGLHQSVALPLHELISSQMPQLSKHAASCSYTHLLGVETSCTLPQARTCTSRSASTWTGSGSSSSSTRTRQQQQGRNPFVQYMVYDYSDIEGEDMDPNGAGFYGWYAQSGSWQSSWEANKKKQQRRQQQQQQQRQAQWQQQQQWQAVAELLQQQDPQILGIVAQVYGEQLEHLTSIQVGGRLQVLCCQFW